MFNLFIILYYSLVSDQKRYISSEWLARESQQWLLYSNFII